MSQGGGEGGGGFVFLAGFRRSALGLKHPSVTTELTCLPWGYCGSQNIAFFQSLTIATSSKMLNDKSEDNAVPIELTELPAAMRRCIVAGPEVC